MNFVLNKTKQTKIILTDDLKKIQKIAQTICKLNNCSLDILILT